ncbi:MAG: zinc ABC transporter substrate-binding protein [Clostridia bacterium]|nr:zinc ABC transporter substrate-binding protein [Clostridia bacterium]
MKRLICLLLALSFVCPLVGCTQEKKDERMQIVTTVFPLYDFANVLLDDCANVRLLLPAGGDLHSYEPTPHDIAALSDADLILCIGGEGEMHIQKILNSQKKENVLSFLEHFREETHEHDGHTHTDEHIWTSPKKAIRIFILLAERLVTLVPEEKEAIEARRDAYLTELQALDASFAAYAKNAPTLIFGDSFPFHHLADDYDLNYLAAIDGCGEDSEPSAARVGSLIDNAKKQNAKVIFYTERTNDDLAKLIASPCGAETARLHSCHNLSAAEYETGETYLSLMQQNLNTLNEAA